MFLAIWFLIGAITVAIVLNNKWRRGEGITVEDLCLGALGVIAGVVSFVIIIIGYLVDHAETTVIKGKDKE
jgi:hypothetical protein